MCVRVCVRACVCVRARFPPVFRITGHNQSLLFKSLFLEKMSHAVPLIFRDGGQHLRQKPKTKGLVLHVTQLACVLLCSVLSKAADQTDSQVDSQVHTSREKWWISRIYSWLAVSLRWAAKGENLATTCVQIWAPPKWSQVNASGWPIETEVEDKSTTTCSTAWVCTCKTKILWTAWTSWSHPSNVFSFVYWLLSSPAWPCQSLAS